MILDIINVKDVCHKGLHRKATISQLYFNLMIFTKANLANINLCSHLFVFFLSFFVRKNSVNREECCLNHTT